MSAPPDLDVAVRLCDHIDACPTPYHAVARAVRLIEDAGGRLLSETDAWPTEPGLYAVTRGGAVVAWRRGAHHEIHHGYRIIGAHTDSPNLRIKPRPDGGRAGFLQLGVEVYGGVLLNSWLDRDLGIAGRVSVRGDDGTVGERLVRVDDSPLRIPQLAIHLDREVNETGLVLDRQNHLAPIWGLGTPRTGLLVELIAAAADVAPDSVVAWDLMLHDISPSALTGLEQSLVSAPRIDNLASCFLAVEALLAADGVGPHVPVISLFDHEEVGSVTSSGASSPLLASVLAREARIVGQASGAGVDDHDRALADTVVLSADGAHATNPNYVDRHEPDHRIAINDGPVLKLNANQRYATDAASASVFVTACDEADVPLQRFVNRTDLACGSTIGPLTAARLGVSVVDVGLPQLAMHSAREMCGSRDPGWFRAAMISFLRG